MTRRPWLTAYRRRRTSRTERCAEVLPDGWRCRTRRDPGSLYCPTHRPQDHATAERAEP